GASRRRAGRHDAESREPREPPAPAVRSLSDVDGHRRRGRRPPSVLHAPASAPSARAARPARRAARGQLGAAGAATPARRSARAVAGAHRRLVALARDGHSHEGPAGVRRARGSRVSERTLVSTLVLNWNGAHLLPDCLATLGSQDWPAHEVLVVDNGSVDDSAAVTARYPARWVP